MSMLHSTHYSQPIALARHVEPTVRILWNGSRIDAALHATLSAEYVVFTPADGRTRCLDVRSSFVRVLEQPKPESDLADVAGLMPASTLDSIERTTAERQAMADDQHSPIPFGNPALWGADHA